MKIFERFTADLDSSGEKVSEELSEVDLSNPEDVKALIPDHSNDILVHFGDTDFLDRYRRFEEHLPEWRTLYPKLSSADMRYDSQVVLEPGSPAPTAGGDDAGPATASSAEPPLAEAKTTAKATPAAHVSSAAAWKAATRPNAKARAAVAKHRVVAAKNKPAAKTQQHVMAQRDVSYFVPAKSGGAKTKAQTATAKHPPVVVGHSSSTPTYHPPQVVHP
jgi:cell division protein FtsQ